MLTLLLVAFKAIFLLYELVETLKRLMALL